MALKALCFWRRPPPVLTLPDLVAFAETRAKFVAQTTLYGYIKTRAGTRYVSLMEDDIFANSVNIAKWEIYLACLCDLAAYAAASVGRQQQAPPDEIRALAIHLVDTAIASEEIPAERPQGFDDIRTTFTARAQATDWAGDMSGDAAFHGSLSALVEWAPIADELKINDVLIVKNSMRFKWKKVRDQFETILDADAVLASWRDQRQP
jgi:hypothetical protein